ncbi:MAG: alpha-amylase family glycosyl hydrolase [Euzebya sp.]
MSHQRLEARLAHHLAGLYPPADAVRILPALVSLGQTLASPPRVGTVDQHDVWLIAYPDHVSDSSPAPTLPALRHVLNHELAQVVNGVHLLPFYPWSSDDGFAVTDHDAVDPRYGTWEDVGVIAGSSRVMVDAVVNHVSADHPWVREWADGRRDGWIMQVDDGFDTSRVMRPRTTPLATAFEGPDGQPRFAWTTFGPDQVDLDYRTPEVLLAMTRVLLGYAARGADIIRLDAVAFLWKESGTTCVHLPQTHQLIRLWRTMLDHFAPGTLLITETNVPHRQNVSYFGDGRDEAHLVYQFPLAPLVLAAFNWGSTQELVRWAASLTPLASGTAFFNFLGSHDGIGLRPVEGMVAPAQMDGLCNLAVAAGGGVSHRANPDGSQSPYELNTTFIDALAAIAEDDHGVARILAAHAILLALQGVAGVWFGAMFGVTNDHELVGRTGRLRSINRGRVSAECLGEELTRPGTLAQVLWQSIGSLIRLRRASPAFAPDSPQQVLPTPGWLFAVVRGKPGGRVMVVVSVSDQDRAIVPADLVGGGRWRDALGDGAAAVLAGHDRLVLPPYGIAWLAEAEARTPAARPWAVVRRSQSTGPGPS